MQIIFFLLGVYIGQEFEDLPSIKNTCMYLYKMYNKSLSDNDKN